MKKAKRRKLAQRYNVQAQHARQATSEQQRLRHSQRPAPGSLSPLDKVLRDYLEPLRRTGGQ